jgi:hypothetical protein
MGSTDDFQAVAFQHVARGVYNVVLPPQATRDDLEYYVEALVPTSKRAGVTLDLVLRVPATAPELNQTVVVSP